MAFACLLVALSVLPMISGSHETAFYQGCYGNRPDVYDKHFQWEPNTNLGCAALCKKEGNILGITHVDMCYCSNAFPTENLTLPGAINDAGPGSPCNLPCSGNMEQDQCIGDECCGGFYNGKETYTVYAVSGIDVIQQIKNRVTKQVMGGNLPWLLNGGDVVSGCGPDFEEKYNHEKEFKMMELAKDQYEKEKNVATLQECMDTCRSVTACRAFVYIQHIKTFQTNPIQVPNGWGLAHVYDRICEYNVQLLVDSFDLGMVDIKLAKFYEFPNSRRPMKGEDLELDQSNSNVKGFATKELKHTATEQLSTMNEIGFSNSIVTSVMETDSMSVSDDSESTVTAGSSTTNEFSTSTTIGAGLEFSISAGGGVDVYVFGQPVFSLEIAATAEINIKGTATVETSSVSTNSESTSTTNGQSESTTDTTSESRSDEYSTYSLESYEKMVMREKTQSYKYTLTVPAGHTGKMSFYEEESCVKAKWLVKYALKGYIWFRVNGEPRRVHVSRVLDYNNRLFYVMLSQTWNRRKVVAVTQMLDPHGNPVVNPATQSL